VQAAGGDSGEVPLDGVGRTVMAPGRIGAKRSVRDTADPELGVTHVEELPVDPGPRLARFHPGKVPPGSRLVEGLLAGDLALTAHRGRSLTRCREMDHAQVRSQGATRLTRLGAIVVVLHLVVSDRGATASRPRRGADSNFVPESRAPAPGPTDPVRSASVEWLGRL